MINWFKKEMVRRDTRHFLINQPALYKTNKTKQVLNNGKVRINNNK